MNTKILIVGVLLVGAVLMGAYSLGLFKSKTTLPQVVDTIQSDSKFTDEAAIRSFMAQPNLELVYINTDLPMPYFRVGKVTKMGNGENMEAVEGWTRKVNVYEQKELINENCAVYEYHTDSRNHTLTTVRIRNLRDSEIKELEKNGNSCTQGSNQMPKMAKAEAEIIAFGYLERALPNFNQIKDQFTYTQKLGGESHEWVWEDKIYQLPEGLEGRPYSYPTIRISVYGDKSISHENTLPLFQN
ncbi:hypothetical protein A3D77_05750 [Candidatus Gottesmanbacteria bacterium RIFCSPHIGHO2_02_FULL_39_11]|uniref:Uncharacterized protein n=1 Tax=Candidatus Gottesmanbacteria bacterium RIFCSPHIGHO2_02_FULL_39_11 TaxID=1798382 RepID=A0A1F5ZYG5_9BACT|nr:MAG: hypothetical protein A3D77_05750 [Candidatus Gottesmanbacteria bacterium RIFCSPHIGHO2_02_FULL_39_11]